MENSAMSLTDQFYVDPSNYEMPDWYEFYNQFAADEFHSGKINGYDTMPDSVWSKIFNFFNGGVDRAREEYNRQKEVKDRAFEEAKLKSARDYQNYLESTKYQRSLADIKKAGYNPALMLQSGLGAANVQPGPAASRTNARYMKADRDDPDLKNLGTSAMKLIALIAMMAAA